MSVYLSYYQRSFLVYLNVEKNSDAQRFCEVGVLQRIIKSMKGSYHRCDPNAHSYPMFWC